MKRYVVVITGASGSAYGFRLVEQLLRWGEVTLVMTPAGAQVAEHELGVSIDPSDGRETVLRFIGVDEGPLRVVRDDDLFDAIASGSSAVDAVVVAPASMGFVGSLASGLASDLAERAADVALKERRPLVIVPRETPLSLIHLRNLTSLAEAGAIVVPAMPAFYHGPGSMDDLIDFVAGKVLDVLGIGHSLFRRWGS